MCTEVCAGGYGYAGLANEVFGSDLDGEALIGPHQSVYMARAGDPDIRRRGAGGGAVTALLTDMMENGSIDGALVVRQQAKHPWKSEPFIARTPEELRDSASSRYSVVPSGSMVREILRSDGRFAVVGLACLIESMRRLEHFSRDLVQKIVLMIGLCCAGTLEANATEEFLRRKHIDPAAVIRMEYRRYHEGQGWPGAMQAQTRDGAWHSLHRLNYKDGALKWLSPLYVPERCWLCPDVTAELSDVTFCDTWIRGRDGRYILSEKDMGWSLCLSRTPRANEVLEGAIARGAVIRQNLDPAVSYNQLEYNILDKRRWVELQAGRRRARNLPVPLAAGFVLTPGLRARPGDRLRVLLRACARNGRFRRFALWLVFHPWFDVFKCVRMRQKVKQFRSANRALEG
jgi:coenzyme F420 hydrogenase subunit beta